MKIRKIILALLFMALLNLLGVPLAQALRPLYSPFSVVAGCQYTAGYKDGSFNTALFNNPLGLSVSDDTNELFVADSGNNRIRVIHLDRNNEVGTVAGQAAAGNLDGPSTLAKFNDPRGVLCLPGDYLAVNDFGNQSLRFLDIKTGNVTTFRGSPVHLDESDTPSPDATPVPLKGITDMAYLASANSIFFTQPDAGVLNILNLGTGQITAVMKNNVQIPHPCALWIQEDKIYVADRDLLNVFSMDWKNNALTNITSAGNPKDKVLSLCSSDQTLYGLLGKDGYPAERFFLDARYKHTGDESNGLVAFTNGWGDTVPPDKYFNESPQPNSPWIGFVPDPTGKRQFFYSIPSVNVIVSLRDLFYYKGLSNNGIFGGEYPDEKPKNTYRILLCGDCLTTQCDPYPFVTESHPVTRPTEVPFFPQQLTIAPAVERELNYQAALDDNPMNYEFLNIGHHGDLMFWPNIEVPPKAKKLDADLVIIFRPNLDGQAFNYYFNYNLTADGIPQSPPDPEYILKPVLERIPEGLPRKFYDYCKAHNEVKVAKTPQGREYLLFDDSVLTDPNLHDMILEFWGKPWDVLQRKLAAMRTSGGKPIRMLVLFGYSGTQSHAEYKPDFYKEVADKYKIPYFDLNPYLDGLYLPYYPVSALGGHFSPDGSVFFAKLLAHILPKEGLIPWPTPETTPLK